jgi:pantoate--beta-alanine ligase
MKIIRTRQELRSHREALSPGVRLGLVPTMGALHEGHLSLVRQAALECDQVWATIFVNPLQFGANEDLSRYPRPFERDVSLLESVGCNALFAPNTSEVYLPDASTRVIEAKVSQPLCGAARPGHFEGVTTVVLKLLNLVQPHDAYFGQKDAQQCAVIERMVRDLDVPVRLHRGATVREADGLALSSRNVYLSEAERRMAPALSAALQAVVDAYRGGESRVVTLESIGRSRLSGLPFELQYLEIRDSLTLERPEAARKGMTVYVAALLGRTRLIDNRELG